jgi:hypothetical protein
MIPKYKHLVKYIKFLIRYKDSVVSRMSESNVNPLRLSIGLPGSKRKILEWIDEQRLREMSEEELERYLSEKWVAQASMTKLPNELVLEVDLEDESQAKINNIVLERCLADMGLKYLSIHTGGKSIHYHILIKPDGLSYQQLKR